MQRRGAQWAPDFVFTESTFQPLVPGPGGGANAKRLAEALGSLQQLAHIVSLLLDRCDFLEVGTGDWAAIAESLMCASRCGTL